jgi:hypothetical protein
VADTATIDAQVWLPQTNHVVYYVCRRQHLSCNRMQNQNVNYITGYGLLLYGAVRNRIVGQKRRNIRRLINNEMDVEGAVKKNVTSLSTP